MLAPKPPTYKIRQNRSHYKDLEPEANYEQSWARKQQNGVLDKNHKSCWKLVLHCLASKCTENLNRWPYQPTSYVHQRWRTRDYSNDRCLNCRPPLPWIWYIRQECFAPLIECSFSFFIHMLSITTGRPILLTNSLHPSTTPHSICPLLRTVSQDTLVIKPRLIPRFNHNRPIRNSITNDK